MAGVSYILSLLFGALSVAMLPPAITGVLNRSPAGEIFFICAGLLGFIAGAMFFALQGRAKDLRRDNAIFAIVLAWLALPLIAAVPLGLTVPGGVMDALFEATSGLTTTGATVFHSVNGLAPAVILWRAELQWLGGLLTLITFAAILSPLGFGGLSARGLAAIGRDRNGVNKTWNLIRGLVAIYTGGTLLCLAALFLAGVPAFDALALSLSTVSTGGFMPRDGSLDVYQLPVANAVIFLFMLVGATSIVWHRYILDVRRDDPAGHLESYWVLAIVAAVALLYFFTIPAGDRSLPDAIARAAFTAASVVSTTGFETGQGALADVPPPLTMFLLFVGGAALSTAGGVKLYRAGVMMIQSGRELHRLVFPNSVQGPGRWGFRPEDGMVKAVWANLSIAMLVVILAALLLALELPSVEASLFAAISAFSNAGPFYTAASPDSPTYASFSDLSKAVMMLTMILGRLEVFVFVALLTMTNRVRF